jgi:hypothetical protein
MGLFPSGTTGRRDAGKLSATANKSSETYTFGSRREATRCLKRRRRELNFRSSRF